jgi:hypothetical protein
MPAPADPDALRHAVRAGAGEDPLARLERAIAVAGELSTAADLLVDGFVAEARAAGCSWAQIGLCLGVSKQGAHQRFGASTQPPPWTGEFGHGAGQILAHAHDEAAALGHNYVGTEHLLLGLLSAREQIAAHALTALGVVEEDVRAQTVARLGEHPPRRWAALGMHPELKQALQRAREWAEHFGHRQVGSEHLLLGLLGVPACGAVQILAGLGADSARVRAQLGEMLIVPPAKLEGPQPARSGKRGRPSSGIGSHTAA